MWPKWAATTGCKSSRGCDADSPLTRHRFPKQTPRRHGALDGSVIRKGQRLCFQEKCPTRKLTPRRLARRSLLGTLQHGMPIPIPLSVRQSRTVKPLSRRLTRCDEIHKGTVCASACCHWACRCPLTVAASCIPPPRPMRRRVRYTSRTCSEDHPDTERPGRHRHNDLDARIGAPHRSASMPRLRCGGQFQRDTSWFVVPLHPH